MPCQPRCVVPPRRPPGPVYAHGRSTGRRRAAIGCPGSEGSVERAMTQSIVGLHFKVAPGPVYHSLFDRYSNRRIVKILINLIIKLKILDNSCLNYGLYFLTGWLILCKPLNTLRERSGMEAPVAVVTASKASLARM